jgi:hypothetical protein
MAFQHINVFYLLYLMLPLSLTFCSTTLSHAWQAAGANMTNYYQDLRFGTPA